MSSSFITSTETSSSTSSSTTFSKSAFAHFVIYRFMKKKFIKKFKNWLSFFFFNFFRGLSDFKRVKWLFITALTFCQNGFWFLFACEWKQVETHVNKKKREGLFWIIYNKTALSISSFNCSFPFRWYLVFSLSSDVSWLVDSFVSLDTVNAWGWSAAKGINSNRKLFSSRSTRRTLAVISVGNWLNPVFLAWTSDGVRNPRCTVLPSCLILSWLTGLIEALSCSVELGTR